MANYGYCGEASLVSAGLYYGQYLSQYDMRSVASRQLAQQLQASQLLLGVNDAYAAKRAHLKAVSWVRPAGGSGSRAFLRWVKDQVLRGSPVIIGVYANQYLFNGDTAPAAGDPEYDHIVTVTGVKSRHALTLPAVYYPDDTLSFDDHGLWTQANGAPLYTFSYRFGAIQATRREANQPTAPPYSLAAAARPYGLAVSGVTDTAQLSLPVRVTTNVNAESPAMREGSSTRPAPMPLRLTVVVSGLQPQVAYHLYRYDKLGSVPDANFNAAAQKAAQMWRFSVGRGVSRFVQTVPIMSNEVAVFRAVPASAP